jgi:hypothetical protein
MYIGSEFSFILILLILGVHKLKFVPMEQVLVDSPSGMLSGDLRGDQLRERSVVDSGGHDQAVDLGD